MKTSDIWHRNAHNKVLVKRTVSQTGRKREREAGKGTEIEGERVGDEEKREERGE